jgi:aldehyde:ferredoxin oxidoreductase
MMKLAGWDGVVVEGKAERPAWINIINDQVKIEDAKELWGLDTWETQDQIASMVGGRTRFGEEWQKIGNAYTTGLPQIVCIGTVGEAKSRLAALSWERGQRAHRWLRSGVRSEEPEGHQRDRNR